MKKILLAFTLLTGGVARAQIVPERTYTVDTYMTAGKLSTGEVKFIGYFASTATTGQIRIYNNDYSVYKQVNITLPTGFNIENINYLSDKLFNTNAGVEFELNLREDASGRGSTRIIDENGTVLLAVDGGAYPDIYNTPGGTKMLLNVRDNVTNKKVYTFYALGGTLTTLAVAPKATANALQPYPNPTAAEIKLPYSVPVGEVAQLVVRDATGRQVATYQVDHSFDHLLFSAQGLPAGVYFYTVGAGAAKRFVIQ